MSIFGGPSLQDLRDLWEAQPMYTYSGSPLGPIAQGWQCPVCKSILAPHVDKCSNCSSWYDLSCRLPPTGIGQSQGRP